MQLRFCRHLFSPLSNVIAVVSIIYNPASYHPETGILLTGIMRQIFIDIQIGVAFPSKGILLSCCHFWMLFLHQDSVEDPPVLLLSSPSSPLNFPARPLKHNTKQHTHTQTNIYSILIRQAAECKQSCKQHETTEGTKREWGTIDPTALFGKSDIKEALITFALLTLLHLKNAEGKAFMARSCGCSGGGEEEGDRKLETASSCSSAEVNVDDIFLSFRRRFSLQLPFWEDVHFEQEKKIDLSHRFW